MRRDIHKMRAFVRFRLVEVPEEGEGATPEAETLEHFVAWFEP